MAYNMEEIIRGIGRTQHSALSKLYSPMLESQQARPESSMVLGPFGQSLASRGVDSTSYGYSTDSVGARAVQDLNDLKRTVAGQTAVYTYNQALANQATKEANEKKEAAKNPGSLKISAEGDIEYTPAATEAAYAGAFPHAGWIKAYIPDDLKDDPEFMRILAAGSHAESGWDVNRIQNGYRLGSGEGARGLFQFDMAGMGKPYLGNEQALLGQAGAELQAKAIVPLYAKFYRDRARSGLTNPADVASWVAAMAERPFDHLNPNSRSRQNYIKSYNEVNRTPGPTAQQTGQGDWISTAKSYLGVKYLWGGVDPNTGFDCSGFVSFILQKRGIPLSGSTMTMFPKTYAIDASQAQPGDLVFYNMNSNDPTVQHVALYIGNGQIIQSGGVQRSVNIAPVNQAVGSAPIFRRAA